MKTEIDKLTDLLVNTRQQYINAQASEDKIFQLLAPFVDDVDTLPLTFDEAHSCESEASTIAELITLYVNYGEGNVDGIVKLIKLKVLGITEEN